MTERRFRVVQWATGHAGYYTTRAILEHPQLDLVGAWVHGADKEGRDVGELVGLDPVGVIATRDIQAIVDLDADCVCYACTDLGRDPAELVDEICRLLASGKSVIGPQYALAHPWGMWADHIDRLEAACAEGGSTLYGCGLQPDGHPLIASTVAGMCQNITSIEIGEMHNVASYDEPTGMFFAALGFGSPADTKPEPSLVEMLNNHMIRPMVDALADVLGTSIESFEHFREFATTDSPIELTHASVEKGTISAVHNRIDGIANDGALRISVHQYYWLGDYPAGWPTCSEHGGYLLEIRGEPDVSMLYSMSLKDADSIQSALLATAVRIVNAIPALCEAEPGIKTYPQMPHVLPRL